MKRSFQVMILGVFLYLALISSGWCAQRESVSGVATQRTTTLPAQNKTTSVTVQPVQNTANTVSAQPQALQPRIDILAPAEGTILEDGVMYKLSWRTFAIAPGSQGKIEFQCGPQGGDNTNPNSLANSMWCMSNHRDLATNPPLEGTIDVKMHKVEHPLYHSGEVHEYELRVSFTNKPDGKNYESIQKIKVKIK